MKKLLTGVVAAVVTLTTAIAGVASASGPETFDRTKDPNGDGVLTVADATYISQCLLGRYFVQRYSNLDMDNNGLVTKADAMLILYYDAGLI